MNDGRIDAARDASWASSCQNCGTPLTGRFCSSCGQRAIPPRPTIRELAGDAWNELVGWDGKLLRTRSGPVGFTASSVAALVIVAHAVVAQRRVYCDSWPKTVVKAVSVAAVYGILWTATAFGVALVAAGR